MPSEPFKNSLITRLTIARANPQSSSPSPSLSSSSSLLDPRSISNIAKKVRTNLHLRRGKKKKEEKSLWPVWCLQLGLTTSPASSDDDCLLSPVDCLEVRRWSVCCPAQAHRVISMNFTPTTKCSPWTETNNGANLMDHPSDGKVHSEHDRNSPKNERNAAAHRACSVHSSWKLEL